jgi:hypothetical protein
MNMLNLYLFKATKQHLNAFDEWYFNWSTVPACQSCRYVSSEVLCYFNSLRNAKSTFEKRKEMRNHLSNQSSLFLSLSSSVTAVKSPRLPLALYIF